MLKINRNYSLLPVILLQNLPHMVQPLLIKPSNLIHHFSTLHNVKRNLLSFNLLISDVVLLLFRYRNRTYFLQQHYQLSMRVMVKRLRSRLQRILNSLNFLLLLLNFWTFFQNRLRLFLNLNLLLFLLLNLFLLRLFLRPFTGQHIDLNLLNSLVLLWTPFILGIASEENPIDFPVKFCLIFIPPFLNLPIHTLNA